MCREKRSPDRSIIHRPPAVRRLFNSPATLFPLALLREEFYWRNSRHLTYTAIYSHFFAGRFLKETPPGKDVDYVSIWLTFSF